MKIKKIIGRKKWIVLTSGSDFVNGMNLLKKWQIY